MVKCHSLSVQQKKIKLLFFKKAALEHPRTYSHLPLIEFILHRFSVNSNHDSSIREREQHKEVHISGSYTSAVLCRYIVYVLIAAGVYCCVQDGKVLKCNRSAAGLNANFVPAALLSEAHCHHVLHDHVIVFPVFIAFATAVAQPHSLFALIFETQFINFHFERPDGARLGLSGPFSPAALGLSKPPALPSLSF